MKHIVPLPLLVCANLFCGCISPYPRPTGETNIGALAVSIPSLCGYDGSLFEVRIYVDDRFVGHYEPEKTVFNLSAGRHTVRVESGIVSSQYLSGQYTLKGEERIEVLGKNSKQNIVFSAANLKEQKLKHED